MTSKALGYILDSLATSESFTVPAALLDSHTEIDRALLDGKALVRSKDFLSEIPCPFGCGTSEPVRKGVKDGKPFYHGRCATLKEYWTVQPEEVELLTFDKAAFDALVRSGRIDMKGTTTPPPKEGPNALAHLVKKTFSDEREAEIKRLLKIDKIEDLEKFDREAIAKQNPSFDGYASLLMALMQYKLRNTPNPEWSAAFTDYETAAGAATLRDLREVVGKGVKGFDLLRGALDSRRNYDGLRFKKLILDLIDAFFEVFDAADFYSGLRQIDIRETPAVKIWSKGGLVDALDRAAQDPARFYRGFKLSKLNPSHLPCVINSLLIFLNTVCKTTLNAEEFEMVELETNLGWSPDLEANKDDEIYFHRTLQNVSSTLKSQLTTLRICEHKVYDRHPEWEITVGTDEGGGQSYNFAKDRMNQSKELCAYYEKYGNPLGRFEEMADMLNADNHVLDALPELEKLIAMPVSYSYESETAWIENADRDSLVIDQINPWIVDAKRSMVEALRAFCDRRANALSPEGKARELWLLVNAKIRLASHGVETEAKAIVDTIKQAAERELVEQPRRGKKPKANKVSQPPKAKRPAGRPKDGADEKDAQVAQGIKWLLEHYPAGNPNEAAQFVFKKYPNFYRNGYKPQEEGKRIADTGLAKAIRREWNAMPEAEKAEKAAELKAQMRTK